MHVNRPNKLGPWYQNHIYKSLYVILKTTFRKPTKHLRFAFIGHVAKASPFHVWLKLLLYEEEVCSNPVQRRRRVARSVAPAFPQSGLRIESSPHLSWFVSSAVPPRNDINPPDPQILQPKAITKVQNKHHRHTTYTLSML